DLLARNAEIRHGLLNGAEDGVVAAPRAPADVLIRFEILLRVFGRRRGRRPGSLGAHALLPSNWLMSSKISSLASGSPRTRLKPTASTRYSARSTRTSWPLLISGTITLRYSRRMWPRSGGSGFRWRRWIDATDRPAACARSTAAVIEPYVPPQPTTSRSPVAGPLIVVGGISCATRRTFSARILTMWSWLSGSYEMLPVTSCFSIPPMRCSSPAVPGTAHGRAKRSSRRYGRNFPTPPPSPSAAPFSWPAPFHPALFGSVAWATSIRGSLSICGIFHGSDPLAR